MIACIYCRWRIRQCDRPDETVRLPFLARHLEDCADCRSYVHRFSQLEHHLRIAPDRLSAAQHAAIEAAVLKRLRMPVFSGGASVPTVRHYRRMAVQIAGIAAMTLVAVMVLRPKPVAETRPPDLAVLAELWEDSEMLSQWIPSWAMLPELSMQAEINRLSHDARQAAAFLLNCVPGHLPEELENGL